MALIDRTNDNQYLVLDFWEYDDDKKSCAANWNRYASCSAKVAGSDALEIIVRPFKGESDYPLDGMTTDAERVTFFHEDMQGFLSSVLERNNDEESLLASKEHVTSVIYAATVFGRQLLEEFAAENVLLGITQAGMTATVRQNCAEIVDALGTGALYDAIDQARAIPSEDKDETFVTDERLLGFVNKIENYLGLDLSDEL